MREEGPRYFDDRLAHRMGEREIRQAYNTVDEQLYAEARAERHIHWILGVGLGFVVAIGVIVGVLVALSW